MDRWGVETAKAALRSRAGVAVEELAVCAIVSDKKKEGSATPATTVKARRETIGTSECGRIQGLGEFDGKVCNHVWSFGTEV